MIGHILISPGEERFGGLVPVARWLIAVAVVGVVGSTIGLLLPGFVLEGPTEPLASSDAIIVISGDEAQSRFRDGLSLYRAGWAPRLIFSGAAWDGSSSNAETMRDLAIEAGVPSSAILVDPEGEDTYGNAVGTRDLMVSRNLHSAILVTSPYHLQRAILTFRGVFDGTDIRIVGRSAPDGEWRKTNWWLRPETRTLTFRELEKLSYVTLTGRYN
jgi:uncharacterized SAM-binding protein YcdF (DUF218 family)